MKKTVFLAIVISLVIASCSKSNDLTENWIGNYSYTGGVDTINRISVSRVNDNTVQMQLQVSYNNGSTFNTYTTLSKVALSSTTAGAINEYGTILGWPDTYHYVGNAALSGNTLTVSATYTDTTTLVVKNYYFLGNK